MAEEEEEDPKQQVADVISQRSGNSGVKKLIGLSLVAALMVGVAAFAGSKMGRASSTPATTQATDHPESEQADAYKEPKGHGAEPAKLSPGSSAYYDLEPIIVNLDEPRLARYIRASIVLSIKPENHKKVSNLIEQRKPELKSFLTVYLAGCTLEDVRGPKNLNRIRREILNAFNDQLFPGTKPLIDEVLFKEFAVQ